MLSRNLQATCGGVSCFSGQVCDTTVIPERCVFPTCATHPTSHSCPSSQVCQGDGEDARCVNYYHVSSSNPSVSLGNIAFGTNDLTVAFWMKTTETGGDVIGNRIYGSHGNFFSIRLREGGKLGFEIDQGGANYGAIGGPTLASCCCNS